MHKTNAASWAGENGSPCIVSLNYHEATKDPRVMKQARSLVQAGCEVHVICDWPSGYPKTEEIDGVKIHRFRCFDPTGASSRFLDSLDFLDKTRPIVHQIYRPFAEAADARRQYYEKFEKLGLDHQALDKSYYKKFSGAERIRKKLRHFAECARLKTRLLFDQKLQAEDLSPPGEHELNYLRSQTKQLMSLLFAENLARSHPEIQPRIVHAHDIYTLPAGVLMSRRYGAKLVYDAHEYEPGRANLSDDGRPCELALALEDDAFEHVDAMITVSSSIADLYGERNVRLYPTVVMNAPEVLLQEEPGSSSKGSNFDIRNRARLAKDTPLIVFTGATQREHRGVDKVVAALEYVPDHHLAIMGPRDERNDEWILSLARTTGALDRVHLLDPVDASDVTSAIASCNVSVIPFQDVSLNHRFAMPNKLFEAAFAGIPICVSDLPEMRRFVETLGIGRVMDQTNPRSIADALRDVCDNPELYSMTDESRKRLQSEYSWDAQKKKLLALYQDLLYPGVDEPIS